MSERIGSVFHTGAVNVTVNGSADAERVREVVTEALRECLREPSGKAEPEDEASRFTIGDVVSLKSGGPRMTVESVSEEEDGAATAHCSWFARLTHDPAFPSWDADGVRYASTASHGVFGVDCLEF